MSTELSDFERGTSNCCNAKRYGDICADCKEHCGSVEEEMEQDRKDAEKELFNMVYNWGRIGVVTDENCNAFQDKLKEIRMI